MLKHLKKLTLLALVCSLPAAAQTAQIAGQALAGGGVPNAQVRVCLSTASGVPCNPVANVYSDFAMTQLLPVTPAGYQFIADAQGNYAAFLAPGCYIVQISGVNVKTNTQPLCYAPLNTSPITGTLLVAPSAVHFGTVKQGTSSFTQVITITNPSLFGSVTISSVSQTGNVTDFIFSSLTACNIQLAPGASCSLTVLFNPSSTGSQETSSIVVNSTAPVDPLSPPTVTLDGTGTSGNSFTLTINGAGTSAGTVVSNELVPLINCTIAPPSPPSGACSANYATGATPQLTATPNGNSSFISYSGGSCSTNPVCTPTISTNTIITATFNTTPQTVSVNILGAGQGAGDVVSDVASVGGLGILNCHISAGALSSNGNSGCGGLFPVGTTITFTETASLSGVGPCTGANCTFTSWIGGSSCLSASTCPVTLAGPLSITANFAPPAGGTALSLVQTNNTAQVGAATSIATKFNSAQGVGHTILVFAAWPNNTTTVSSVTDTKGNSYSQFAVISPATQAGETAVAYCATGIVAAAAGANTVTIALSTSTSSVDERILEYAGVVDCTPDDKNVGKATTGTAMDSGAVTTTQPNDLLVASNSVASNVNLSGPSNGQTWSAAIARTSFGNDVEQILGVPTGTYHNLASQTSTGDWISQIIALKTTTVTSNTSSLTIQCPSNGSGTVTSTFGTPNINATCNNGTPGGVFSTVVANGSSGRIDSTPGPSSTFINYSGGGCGTNPSCTTAAITTNTTIVVNFVLMGTTQYFLNASTGSDSNSGLCAVAGTPAGCTGPWLTLVHANSAFVLGGSGTQINLNPGTYSVTSGSACFTSAMCVTRSGLAGRRVLFTCTTPTYGSCQIGTTIWLNNVNFVDVVGLSVGPLPNNNNALAAISTSAAFGNSLHIYGDFFHDVGQNVSFGGIAGCTNDGMVVIGPAHAATYSNSDIQVIGNLLFHYGIVGNGCNNGHGVYLGTAGGIVQNNLISNITTSAVEIFNQGANTDVSNNTIWNSGRGVQIAGSNVATGKNTIANNAIVDTTIAIDLGSGSGTTCVVGSTAMLNNSLFGNGTNFLVGVNNNPTSNSCETFSGNITNEAPATSFTSYVKTGDGLNSGNMLLKAGSKLLDGGTTNCVLGVSGCVPLIDYTGLARPQGPSYSIGAYEQ